VIARPSSTRSTGWRLTRVMAVGGLLVAAGLGPVATASAHSQLEATDPLDGSQVAALPDQVTLRFNQNVLGLGTVLQVTGPAGNVAAGRPKVIDNQVVQPVQAGSPAGAYTVQWRVTSADGHPISGRFGFTAAAGNGGTAPDAASAGTAKAADDDPAESGQAVLWLLVAGGAAVVAAGVALARRRPGANTFADAGGSDTSDGDSGGSSDGGGGDGGGGGGGD